MKANVYDAFLTDKVKVFATQKDVKPFVLPRKIMKKAAPFLIASAMTLTACSPKTNETNTSDNGATNYSEIYKEVVEKYNLTSLMAKEPFSQDEINDMIIHNNPPELVDYNFNHCPENVENFWEIVKNGIRATKIVQKSPTLNFKQKKEYQIVAFKMLSQMTRIKGTKDAIDLSDYNNLKTFLYFEKLLKYGDNYEKVLEKDDGLINEQAELFGRYYKDFEILEKKAQNFPGVRKFAYELYNNNDRFMLSYQDSVQANKLSKQLLQKWMKKQNITDENLWYLTSVEEDGYANAVAYWHRRGTTVELSLGIDSRGNIDEGDFSPVGAILIHELQHVMQKKPSSPENPEDNQKSDEDVAFVSSPYDESCISELGPTLYSLAIEDRLYKHIKGIDQDKVLDYGALQFGKSQIKLGEVAVWFGKMIDKYPENSVDKLVAKDEILQQLNQWGNGQINSLHRTKSSER